MTAVLVGDEQLHAAAVLSRLNDVLPDSVTAYDSDEVPATKPSKYVEVTLTRRPGGNLRSAGNTSTAGWRISTRVVDKVSITNARRTANTVRNALEFFGLTVAGKPSTPIQFETAEPVGPDDGWWSGLTTWTYAL